MRSLLRLFKRRRRPAPATEAARANREDADWVVDAMRGIPAPEAKQALELAGFRVDARTGELIQRPGRCPSCHDHHILQRGLDSGRWLCHKCSQDELCSS